MDGAADTVDDGKLAAALRDGAAEVNGYIAKVVTLPIAAPPDMLRVVCRDLAVYRLYANAGRVTETQDKLRDASLSYLRMVRDGKVSIGDETGGEEILSSEGAVTVEGPDRVMTRDSLSRF
jgi:phage gp36-like protein